MSRNVPRITILEDRLAPAIATWDGGGTDNHWTTAANWSGDVVPQAGDDLMFPAGAAQQTNVNDFSAGMQFHSLTLNDFGYKISGNSINVTAGVTADLASSGIRAAEINLAIGGAGGVTKSGDGELVLGAANTYLGMTTVMAGSLDLTMGAGLGATGSANGTVVAPGAALLVGYFGVADIVPEDVTFSSGPAGESALHVFGDDTLTGLLTLSGDGTISIEDSATIARRGIAEAGGSHNLTLNGGTLTFDGTSVNSVTGTTIVLGSAVFNGAGPFGTIVGGGHFVAGTGSIGPLQMVNFSRLIPGVAISDPNTGQGDVGTLTTGDLTLQIESKFVADLTPNGVDRIDVHGIVSIQGLLTLAPDYAFGPLAGAHYRIIDNDGVDPVQGVFRRNTFSSDQLTEGAVVANFADTVLQITYRGGDGNDVELIGAPVLSLRRFAVGAGAGGVPQVNVYDGTGALVRSFAAYDINFHGGVRVATGDVDGDGVPDVVTAAGVGGGPHVKVFSGVSGGIIEEFMAYDLNFRGGVFVALADFGGFRHADIITGAGAGGGPHVKVFDGASAFVMFSFLAYDPAFTGGVTVAGFDAAFGPHASFNPGVIVTGAGPGGGPHVKAFIATGPPGVTPPVIGSFFAYDASFHGGVNVAADGSVLNHAFDLTTLTLVTSPASASAPDVRIFNVGGQQLGGFLAYDAAFLGGVTVKMRDLGPGESEIVTGAGPGGGPHVRIWLAVNNVATLDRSLLPFDPAFTGGVFVG